MTHPLILVVGPSGSGKDTLMRKSLAASSGIALARRTITRPADVSGEDHCAATYEEFAGLEIEGAFALSWEAHGLSYGIPYLELKQRENGPLLVNASRGIIDEAREKFGPLHVMVVTARLDVLAKRLRERGREDSADVERRLERARLAMPVGADVITIDNSGDLSDGVAAFSAALDKVTQGSAR